MGGTETVPTGREAQTHMLSHAQASSWSGLVNKRMEHLDVNRHEGGVVM